MYYIDRNTILPHPLYNAPTIYTLSTLTSWVVDTAHMHAGTHVSLPLPPIPLSFPLPLSLERITDIFSRTAGKWRWSWSSHRSYCGRLFHLLHCCSNWDSGPTLSSQVCLYIVFSHHAVKQDNQYRSTHGLASNLPWRVKKARLCTIMTHSIKCALIDADKMHDIVYAVIWSTQQVTSPWNCDFDRLVNDVFSICGLHDWMNVIPKEQYISAICDQCDEGSWLWLQTSVVMLSLSSSTVDFNSTTFWPRRSLSGTKLFCAWQRPSWSKSCIIAIYCATWNARHHCWHLLYIATIFIWTNVYTLGHLYTNGGVHMPACK